MSIVVPGAYAQYVIVGAGSGSAAKPGSPSIPSVPSPPPDPDPEPVTCDPFVVGDVTNMYPGSVTLTTDGDIVALSGFDGMSGNLYVGPGVTSLEGLEDLRYVGGSVDLSGATGLTNLAGLEWLTNVQGDLNFNGNSSITTLEHLVRLHLVKGNLTIIGMSALTTLEGAFGCLDVVGDDTPPIEA